MWDRTILMVIYESERLPVLVLSPNNKDRRVFVEADEIEISKMVCQGKVDEIMKYSVVSSKSLHVKVR